MSEREKRDFNYNDRNNSHGNWGGPSIKTEGTGPLAALPVPAKQTESLLSLWSSKQQSKANSGHVEFAGRNYGERKAELYAQMRYVCCR